MKHTFGILLSLFLLLPASNAVAQRLNGIRVESHTPIEVFVDGVKVCNRVNSCMIANLRRGTYFVEVFAPSGHYGSRQAVFSQNVRYSGSGIKDIFIDGNIDDDEIYLPGTLRPMSFWQGYKLPNSIPTRKISSKWLRRRICFLPHR